MDNKHRYSRNDLKLMQSWTLERKIRVTQTKIIEYYNKFDGKVYISFSGGKDSTVLLDLARRCYPDIEAVFVDTGLEYPEIRNFVKTHSNVTWLKPIEKFEEVIKGYGFPVISKPISRRLWEWERGNRAKWIQDCFSNKNKVNSYNIGKWGFLRDAPFKCSSHCCDIMKKKPLLKIKKAPIIGTTAAESQMRLLSWLKGGCNSFEGKPQSKPMSFWTEQDILKYLKITEIPYSSIYGEIVDKSKQITFFYENIELKLTGVQRTGCMFCMFGVHLEKQPNRFQRMKKTHPKQYDYCINKLGCGEVLNYIGIKY